MAKYAEGTTVTPEKSQAEIGALVRRFGASNYLSGWDGDRFVVRFTAHERQVRFLVTLPPADAEQFTVDGRGYLRTDAAAAKAHEAEGARLWRALALAIKAKLEVVSSGIASFEEEFAAHVVLPDGSTVGEWLQPQLERVYATAQMPPLLALGSGR